MPTGAEMLILQQSVKYYIELSWTRPLAHHEQADLQKLMTELAPALKRYQESPALTQPNTATGTSVASNASREVYRPQTIDSTPLVKLQTPFLTTMPTRKPNNANTKSIRVKKESNSQTLIGSDPNHTVPATAAVARPNKTTSNILGAKNTNRQSTVPQLDLGLTKPAPTASLGVKTNRLTDVTNINSSNNKNRTLDEKKSLPPTPQKKVLGNATNTINTTNTTANRTKVDNRPSAIRGDSVKRANTKRTRTFEDDESENDDYKENIDPRRPFSGRRRTTSQGAAVATIRSQITPRDTLSNSRDNVVNILDGRNYNENSNGNSYAYPPRTIPRALSQQQDQQRQNRFPSDSTSRSVTDASFVGQLRLSSVIHDGRTQIQTNASSVPYKQTQPQDSQCHSPPQTQGDDHSNIFRFGSRSLERDQYSPIEVPASVDDDESVKSLGDLRALTPEYPLALDHPKACVAALAAIPEIPEMVDYEEVPDSQCSQSSQSSGGTVEGATLAMPMFLENSLPEIEDDSLPSNNGLSRVTDTPTESTKLVDGVWCFDEFKDTILATVCSNHKQWIAVETRSRVLLWQLSDETSHTDCRWMRRFQLDKLSHGVRVMFAPDDSAAVIVNMTDSTIVHVPLASLSGEGDPEGITNTVWKEATWSRRCNSFIIDGKNDQKWIVAGSIIAGSVCLVDVSNPRQQPNSSCLSQTLCCTDVSEVASSIAQVQNSKSLILATFGETIVLWDLMSYDKPVAMVDVAEALSSFRLSLSADHQPYPTLVAATVPKLFLQAYNSGSNQSNSALPASQWPIFVTVGVKIGPSYHFENEHDQCALFLMNGSKIQLVHKYYGTRSISSAFASSQFLACQTITEDGKSASLQLWDLCDPESIATLALVTSAEQQNLLTQEPRQQQWVSRNSNHANSDTHNNCKTTDSLDGSSLSPPPSSLSFSSDEDDGLAQGSGHQLQVHAAAHSKLPRSTSLTSFLPAESMSLRSVAFMDRAAEVQFSLHAQYQWAVVVKQVRNVSTMHVVDFGALLY
ncbi:hypothetical protein BGZ83_009000 [Gryganskiella cystojenkinii]|nr:hypothetical protein BGZ83_009000 [Gryganskiella cystojenkinii]